MATKKVSQSSARSPRANAKEATERVGAKLAELVARSRHREAFLHESLIEICDLLSEGLASFGDDDEVRLPDPTVLEEVNRRVWKLRRELSLSGGEPVTINKRSDGSAVAP